MFDVTSSKLLILGVVALLVIGPKDLPALLRTIGRYVGIIKRQAAEFRAQFEEAIRESELEQLKKEVETLGSATEEHMRSAERSLEAELGTLGNGVTQADGAGATPPAIAPAAAEEHTAAAEAESDALGLAPPAAAAADPPPPHSADNLPLHAPADPPPHSPDHSPAQAQSDASGALGSEAAAAPEGEAAAGTAPLRTPEKSGV
jgi:sec-independent protein translocase protein TatB